MAMAKNFALHGIWGMDKYGFSSSTSSPLWTLLLSGIYWLFGASEIAPLIMNILFASLILIIIYTLAKKFYSNQLIIFLLLLSIIFFTPMPAIIFVGMEHTLHALFIILLVNQSAKILTNKNNSRFDNFLLLLFSATAMSARYESIFVIFVICFLFILKKRIIDAIAIVISALSPVILYGIYSISLGSFFLPNSILLKGSGQFIFEEITQFILSPEKLTILPLIFELFRAPYLLFMIILTLLILIINLKKNKLFNWGNICGIIFVITSILHLAFASVGWFYRYEAYLLPLGIFSIFAILKNLNQEIRYFFSGANYLIALIMFFILLLPFADRAILSLIKIPTASRNIYEQQYQMGLFLKKFYKNQTIALNDIGLASYIGEIQLLDLAGLGNAEVAQAKLEKKFNTQYIDEITKQKNARIAIIYDNWFKDENVIPKQWRKTGEWTLYDNIVCGDNTVSFYAVDSSVEKNLIKNLRTFSNELPQKVIQKGIYVNSK
jgi:hypothetical protein